MEIVGAFQETASSIAKNIIDEYHIHPHYASRQEKQGSTQPHLMPGQLQAMHEGLSITQNGIEFQFACNYDGMCISLGVMGMD
jgi:hypothetical protein